MTKDIKMLDRMWVKGLTKFEKWKAEFEKNMVESTVEDMLKVATMMLPPEQLDILIRDNPELSEMIGRIKGG